MIEEGQDVSLVKAQHTDNDALKVIFEHYQEIQKEMLKINEAIGNQNESKKVASEGMKPVNTGDNQESKVNQMSRVQIPPNPIAGPFGNLSDIKEGYSFKYNQKMPIDMYEMYGESGFNQIQAKYEIASL